MPWALGFLSARAAPSIERVTEHEYRRSLRIDGAPATLVVRHVNGSRGEALEVRSTPRIAPAVARAIVRRLFDLDADLDAFHRLSARDPILRRLVPKRPGLRLPQLADPFEAAVRAVLGQQVSVAAARTMVDRVASTFGEVAPEVDGVALRVFPSPADLIRAGEEGVRGLGLTRAKAAALIGIAAATLDGSLDWERLRTAEPNEAESALRAMRGIGPWTASYLRMRALGDRDAFPAADLGVIRALERFGVSRDRIERVAERWRPWRGYATAHLWAGDTHD